MSNFGGAGGAEYEFITQDHATSIQMKLAWRAYLERNISRSPDFICLDMSSAHRKTRLAWLAGKSAGRASPRLAARGHTGHTAQMHNYNQIAFAITLVAHAVRCRASTLEARARNSFYITNVCGKAGKPSRSSGRARGEKPRPPARTRLSPLQPDRTAF